MIHKELKQEIISLLGSDYIEDKLSSKIPDNKSSRAIHLIEMLEEMQYPIYNGAAMHEPGANEIFVTLRSSDNKSSLDFKFSDLKQLISELNR